MKNKRNILITALATCLGGAASSAQADTVDAFGLTHTSIGAATISFDATARRLPVHNLGSSGQDGVSVDLSRALTPGQNFSWDGVTDLGPYPAGGFVQTTTHGSLGGGTTGVMSTFTALQGPTDVALTADFSPVSNGQPLTIEYRTGGPNGTVVYSEHSSGPTVQLRSTSGPDTFYIDWDWNTGPSGGWDYNNNNGASAFLTAGGLTLPPSDNIDFIDVVAPSNIAAQYSDVSMTAGGGISSFTLTNEIVTAPEPSALALVGVGGVALLKRRNRKPA